MDYANGSAESDLPRLKQLASEILTSEAPDLDVLERMAELASGIAARRRQELHRQCLELVIESAGELFPGEVDDLRAKLADTSLDEISNLRALLDNAVAARKALATADEGLMAARDRGDYAAMAPLAIEADTQKKVFAKAGTAFAERIGLGAVAMPEPAAPAAPAEPANDSAADLEAASVSEPTVADPEPDLELTEDASSDSTGTLVRLDLRHESRGERRRVRDLIRQMRSVPGDAS